MLSISPMAAPMAAEMKKIDGVVVLAERTQKMMGSELKSREEVTAVETKEPAPGLYDVPKDFTEKPLDPVSELRKLVGSRPNAGPGDGAPKPNGEEPAPRRREKQGGEEKKRGGDEKQGG